jgi:hypothetical protein
MSESAQRTAPLPSEQINSGLVKPYIPYAFEFEHEGRTFIYEYSRLGIIQIQRAETVFRYREEQEHNPPMTLELLEASAGGEYVLEAFRHLLIEKQGEQFVRYNKDTRGAATRDWLEYAPAELWRMLREARRDFFTLAGLQDIESSRRYLRSTKAQLEAVELDAKAKRIALDMQQRLKEEIDSTIEANSKDASENLARTE